MIRTSAVMLAALCLLLPHTARADKAISPCELSIVTLDQFIASAPNNCTADSDCGGYYIRAHTCLGPAILSKKTESSPEFQTQLAKEQEKVHLTCAEEWKRNPMPACSPSAISLACVDGKCVDPRITSHK